MTSEECSDRLFTASLTDCILLPLNCTSKRSQKRPFTIILRRISPDVYNRYLAGEIVDFDKYCNNLFENINRTTIYVRDPVYDDKHLGNRYTQYSRFSKQFAGKFYNGLITFDQHSLKCYATDEWFVTPPGHIISPNRVEADDWRLRLSGWSGFAALTFKDVDENLLRITIVYGHTATFGTAFSLHLPGPSDANVEVIKACFDQHEGRNPLWRSTVSIPCQSVMAESSPLGNE